MGIRHKIGDLLCLALLLSTNVIYGQEKAPKMANTEKASTSSNSLQKIEAPKIAHLACPETTGISPLLALSAKAKLGEQYQTVRLGCLDLTINDLLLDESNLTGLEQAANYITSSDSFIRIYIDLEDAQVKDQELLKRFRTKAFAVRKLLTEKGVYAHLKTNREGLFASHFPIKEIAVKKIAQAEKKVATKPKSKLKPRDPSLDYAFHIERSSTFISEGNLGIYGNHQTNIGFQFIPMQSIYFSHDHDQLTVRAQTTLLAMVEYILGNPNTDKLIIQAHADEVGTDKYNYRLTDRRAVAVRDFVIENGIPEEIVEIISRGEIQPVDENWTRQGKARNRRVELYIVQRNTRLETTLAPVNTQSNQDQTDQ